MTQDEHDIIMIAARTERLEKQMGELTTNVLTLSDTVRVTNAAIVVFHDSQKNIARKLTDHDTALGEIRATSNKFKGGWWLLTVACSFVAGGAGVIAVVMSLLKNIKGTL